MDTASSTHRTTADTAGAAAFRMLAACYGEPTAELPALLRDTLEHLAPMGVEVASLANELTAIAQRSDHQELLKDYAKLFVGPFQLLAPPFGSVYLDEDGRLMGDSTMDAVRFYQLAGLDMAENFKMPPDHVVAELEFLYCLYKAEMQRMEDYPDQAETFAGLRREFFRQHLGRWGRDFAAKVAANASTDFYRLLGQLTARILELEKEREHAAAC
jgi:putative dimethyl sulfoxide reductase chaperone